MNLALFPIGVLLPVTMASYLSSATLKNYYSKRISSSTRGCQLYNLVSFAVCTLLLFFYAGCRLEGSLFTVLVGAAFGAVTALTSAFELTAMSIGPMSYTTVLTSSSTVITAISGLFFGETIPLLKWIGIGLMMVCMVLAGMKKNRDAAEKKASLKWLLFSVLAALFAASVGLLQKVHQESSYQSELSLMLFVAFAFSTLLSFVLYLLRLKKDPPVLRKAEGKLEKKALILILAIFVTVGVVVTMNNVINLYLVGVMDSAVFFPLVNGGHLILCTLVGLLFFREKLAPLQWVGMISGILAVFCLCL